MRARVSQLKQKVAGTPVSSLELEAFIRDVGKVSDADTLQVRLPRVCALLESEALLRGVGTVSRPT